MSDTELFDMTVTFRQVHAAIKQSHGADFKSVFTVNRDIIWVIAKLTGKSFYEAAMAYCENTNMGQLHKMLIIAVACEQKIIESQVARR